MYFQMAELDWSFFETYKGMTLIRAVKLRVPLSPASIEENFPNSLYEASITLTETHNNKFKD